MATLQELKDIRDEHLALAEQAEAEAAEARANALAQVALAITAAENNEPEDQADAEEAALNYMALARQKLEEARGHIAAAEALLE